MVISFAEAPIQELANALENNIHHAAWRNTAQQKTTVHHEDQDNEIKNDTVPEMSSRMDSVTACLDPILGEIL